MADKQGVFSQASLPAIASNLLFIHQSSVHSMIYSLFSVFVFLSGGRNLKSVPTLTTFPIFEDSLREDLVLEVVCFVALPECIRLLILKWKGKVSWSHPDSR